jgi:hypothetical protein
LDGVRRRLQRCEPRRAQALEAMALLRVRATLGRSF